MNTKKAKQVEANSEFAKLKKYVLKRIPGARCSVREAILEEGGTAHKLYSIVDQQGNSVVDPELLIPPALSVREAWEQAKYCSWFSNMIRKSNAAFCEEKIFKAITKERGGGDD